MTKRELVLQISDETALIQADVSVVVQRLLDTVKESLAKGETVELRDFGVFEVVMRKPRVGRNPNEPMHTVLVPARAVGKFRAGKSLKKRVLSLSQSMEFIQPASVLGNKAGLDAGETIPSPAVCALESVAEATGNRIPRL